MDEQDVSASVEQTSSPQNADQNSSDYRIYEYYEPYMSEDDDERPLMTRAKPKRKLTLLPPPTGVPGRRKPKPARPSFAEADEASDLADDKYFFEQLEKRKPPKQDSREVEQLHPKNPNPRKEVDFIHRGGRGGPEKQRSPDNQRTSASERKRVLRREKAPEQRRVPELKKAPAQKKPAVNPSRTPAKTVEYEIYYDEPDETDNGTDGPDDVVDTGAEADDDADGGGGGGPTRGVEGSEVEGPEIEGGEDEGPIIDNDYIPKNIHSSSEVNYEDYITRETHSGNDGSRRLGNGGRRVKVCREHIIPPKRKQGQVVVDETREPVDVSTRRIPIKRKRNDTKKFTTPEQLYAEIERILEQKQRNRSKKDDLYELRIRPTTVN